MVDSQDFLIWLAPSHIFEVALMIFFISCALVLTKYYFTTRCSGLWCCVIDVRSSAFFVATEQRGEHGLRRLLAARAKLHLIINKGGPALV